MRNKMTVSIVIILLITIVSNSQFLKIPATTRQTIELNEPTSDLTLSFLNKLFSLQNLPLSQQLQNCFKNSSIDSLKISQIISQWAINGSKQSSSTLPKILNQTLLKINNTITKDIRICIQGSHDFNVLLHRFNITNQAYFYEKFNEVARSKFLDVHYWFTNMSEIFANRKLNQTQKYQKCAEIANDMAINIYSKYGIRADDPWKIRVQQVETLSQYFGISVSNGVLGVVSSQKPFKLQSSVLAGAYDKIGRGRVDNLVQTFPALNMKLYFGDSGFKNYVQQLNLKQGSMTHSLGTSQMSISYTYYTLQNLPNVFYTEFTTTAHIDANLDVQNIHEAPQAMIDLRKNYQDIQTSVGTFKIISSIAKTKTGKLTLVSSSAFKFLNGDPTNMLHQDWDSGLHLLKFNKQLKKGQQFKFAVITCLLSSENHEDPENQAIRMVIRASSLNNIVNGHIKAWQSLWESDIIIQGNDADQKYVRTMLYHCYSFISSYKSYGLSPMGLSGLGYNGHVFWDMDLWIYPAILILKPSLAKSLINYRFQRLEAAKQNAFLNGYKGAMFPWQSSKTGDEQTPVWALSGPLQHHISGCVAFGAWNYYSVTQDKQWLIEKGYPIIQQVAMFFQSRVELGDDGYYHIKNVVGADQWAQNIDDNAFTNGIAKVSLSIANRAAKILNLPINTKWELISNKIIILKMPNGVTRQHATYNGESIKQADVNLLAYPLTIVNKTEDILKDLQYYQVRVPNQGTPAMTYSIFTVLYSKLKNSTLAYKNFKESFLPFLRKPFGAFAETKGGSNPYFLTGAGGVLQSVIFGFGGFNIGDQGVFLTNNSIPAEWKKVTIKTQAKTYEILSQNWSQSQKSQQQEIGDKQVQKV